LSVFQATFLGHQGWLFRSGSTAMLVDPLLTEGFGHGGLVGEIYPPRRIDPAAFPAIDAVVLSHEHDDHFDIPSLHRLDRRIPIYLSSRASRVGRETLAAMGFSAVRPLHPGRELSVGRLRLRTFAVDHRGRGHGDEWEVFPFILRDVDGHGSFASSIDVPPPPQMLMALRELAPRPGIWCYANNFTSAAHQRLDVRGGAGERVPASDRTSLASVVLRRYAAVEREWGTPAIGVICGAGWSFSGARAQLNHAVFPVDSEALARMLAAMVPESRFAAALPGMTVSMERGELSGSMNLGEGKDEGEAFIAPLPRSSWPARDYRPGAQLAADYGPATGRVEIAPASLEELARALEDFARFLYGGAVFRALLSLTDADAQGRRPAIALRLRTGAGGGASVLRYDPTACAFVPDPSEDPVDDFVSGMECWASDLLALLRGEIGPTALCYAGRLRTWNHAPRWVYFGADTLWMFSHPLRRPAATAALYRELLAVQPVDVARVPAKKV